MENEEPSKTHLRTQVRHLVIGRLLAIVLLLVSSWLWYSGTLSISFDQLPSGPLQVFLVSLALSAIYLLATFAGKLEWQVPVQFVLDAGLITWLVWLTGDLSSPYITLYIVLISVSSLFLRPLSTLLMAVLSAVLFVGLAILVAFSIIMSHGSIQPPGKMIQIASFHVVAFLVVGLLAARLSDRRFSGEQLKETAKSLASLRALHERIVESIRSGLITTDLDGKIYSINAAGAEITGYMPEAIIGRSAVSLFGDLSEPIRLSVGADMIGEQLPRFEADLSTPEGFAIHVGFSICQLLSEDKEATGYIITFQDLTEVRSMEESVRRKDRLAAVGRVGAGLAHEIRNPLGAMRGAIQVLESSTPPESMQADLMGIILRESDRLNSIITNFLSYARPKVGDYTETDVCEAVRDTLTLLRHGPDVSGEHKFFEDLPQDPVFIAADVTQLKQVFWNLARNSLNAMPEGGKLTFRVQSIPVNRVRIEVEDTGVGMSQEQVSRIFEPFSVSTTGGTGLGLSIVYQIIREHGGTVNVKSYEGEGTKITIELPVEQTAKPDANGALDRTHESQAPSPLTGLLNVKKTDG